MKAAEADRVFNKLEMKIRNGKDKLAYFYYDGKYVLHTMRSHGRGDLGNISNVIRQQLKVSESQFADLRDCSMDREAYVRHLKTKGLV